eukprot:371698-Amphidinium_carterae.1
MSEAVHRALQEEWNGLALHQFTCTSEVLRSMQANIQYELGVRLQNLHAQRCDENKDPNQSHASIRWKFQRRELGVQIQRRKHASIKQVRLIPNAFYELWGFVPKCTLWHSMKQHLYICIGARMHHGEANIYT